MRKQNNISFFVSAILLCITVYAVYPFYQYYVDPDATAYFAVIKRYLAGDMDRAINGYWSPWSIWLTAGLVKVSKWALMPSAVIVNTLGAVLFLFISHSFLRLFKISNMLQWVVQLSLVVFLGYAVYGQLFDDLWECFFLLVALRLMLRDDFKQKAWIWIAVGISGTLAYYSKSYAFLFFILNTVVCSYFIADNRTQWLKISAACTIVMIAGVVPWMIALHDKYGIWTIGTAGKMNLSWYTVGHPYWKEGITHLVPPTYGDSPYYWEDAYLVNGATPTAFSSFGLLKMQLVRIPFNILKMIVCMNELSAIFVVLFGVMIAIVLSKKVRQHFPGKMHVVAISFLLFPLGYVLINFESRYLWYMLPLAMLMGALLLEKLFLHFGDSRWMRPKAYLLFALAFVYFPVLEMKSMYRVGEEDHRVAERMRSLKGSFTAIPLPGIQLRGVERIAYFSDMPFYMVTSREITHEQLLTEMKRYGVKYYLYFYNRADGNGYNFTDTNGKPLQEVMRDENYGNGIRLFEVE